MSCRVSHIPHARSGGIAPVIVGMIAVLTATAVRERNDPRAGTTSVMARESISNGDISQW
ncbi:hypothetical protein NIIDMKKI_22040 [Mycobacterium kansasii]|uniref:Uncharacterized protein n=1 Tax=Mycobacterium kansasii TaxID=1768 RepID=A0A7G1IER2_MYCKA|nr:hypothetical protein NIIDMKKI_22040 [Mycobacterium kansasii]